METTQKSSMCGHFSNGLPHSGVNMEKDGVSALQKCSPPPPSLPAPNSCFSRPGAAFPGSSVWNKTSRRLRVLLLVCAVVFLTVGLAGSRATIPLRKSLQGVLSRARQSCPHSIPHSLTCSPQLTPTLAQASKFSGFHGSSRSSVLTVLKYAEFQ